MVSQAVVVHLVAVVLSSVLVVTFVAAVQDVTKEMVIDRLLDFGYLATPFSCQAAILRDKSMMHFPDCQPTFPGYHITSDYDAIHQGCYKTSGRVFPAQAMVDIPFDFDWKKMFRVGHGKELVQKCGAIAIENGARYFGISDYSNCFHGNTPDLSESPEVTPEDGCNKYCEWDIGGPGAIVVYEVKAITSKPECQSQHLGYKINREFWAMNRGCYRSQADVSVFPTPSDTVMNLWSEINWLRINGKEHAGSIVQQCGALALERGFSHFWVENYALCYLGNQPDYSAGEVTVSFGCTLHCSLDVGHTGIMVVYEVQPVLKPEISVA
ncbi:hypothetical protein PoB_001165700 [Plakobranchus ocellatus]|uniref:WSC domain-containing protein n=1 Tax=Plakobranchus ocellatus TaxID=259542 RepID=A0AAV3YRN6_9GAST|nr:hypothetical protein PoB_001165700 [Plakobranchus ocellatus]